MYREGKVNRVEKRGLLVIVCLYRVGQKFCTLLYIKALPIIKGVHKVLLALNFEDSDVVLFVPSSLWLSSTIIASCSLSIFLSLRFSAVGLSLRIMVMTMCMYLRKEEEGDGEYQTFRLLHNLSPIHL